MKNEKGFIHIILILVIVILVAGAYFIGTKNGNLNSIIKIGNPTPIETSIPIVKENTLQTIKDITSPIIWSTPKADTYDYRNSHGDTIEILYGQSMTSTIPEKSQDKVAPLFATSNSTLITTYGWTPGEGAGGVEGETQIFNKTINGKTQVLYLGASFTKGIYTVFISN